MIRLTRAAQLVSRDAGRWYAGWSDAHTRVYVVRSKGLRVDAAPLGSMGPRTPRVGHLNIQLDGALVSRRSTREQTIRARSLALEPSILWNERWIGPTFRALVLEWDAGFGPAPDSFALANLAVVDHARLEGIADVLERESDGPRVIAALGALSALLRAIGLPIDGLESLARSTERERDVATARLLSSLRSSLHRQPAWIDAVSDARRSERQLRRDVSSLVARLNLSVDGLRAVLVRERVLSAAALLTAKGATVAEVARCVGFGSSRALGHALERAGLPSATALASLGRDD
jgi:hypothetical protein